MFLRTAAAASVRGGGGTGGGGDVGSGGPNSASWSRRPSFMRRSASFFDGQAAALRGQATPGHTRQDEEALEHIAAGAEAGGGTSGSHGNEQKSRQVMPSNEAGAATSHASIKAAWRWAQLHTKCHHAPSLGSRSWWLLM